LVDLIIQLFFVDEAEVVFFATVEPVLDAHRDAGVFDRVMKRLAAAGLAVNLEGVAAEDLQVRGDGNVDLTVERVTEKRAALFFDTDDAQGQPANFQRLTESV